MKIQQQKMTNTPAILPTLQKIDPQGSLGSPRLPHQKKTGCSLYTNDIFASESNSPRQQTSNLEPHFGKKTSQFYQPQCRNCQLWKQWSLIQEREMLQLQQKLMQKQQKMVSILSRQHKELTIQRNTIEQLEKTLNQEKGKIAALETELDRVNKRCQELEVRKIKCETPKKDDKNIENELKGKLSCLELGTIEKTEKYQNFVKTSAITTKTEGWGCEETHKKDKIEARSALTKRSDIQRCLFENQTLKDYNSTLLERLTSARYKKSIY